MQKFFSSLVNILDAFRPYVWVLVAFAVFYVGGLFIIGGDEGRQKGKKQLPWILFGTGLAIACVYLGKEFASYFAF